MKVVLTKDVKNMGRAGSVIDASDGHALNFLIPRALAVLATPAALAQAEARKSQTEAASTAHAAATGENFAKLATQTITLTVKVNEQGHLYTGVGAADIAQAVEVETGIALPTEAIDLDKPLKEAGEYEIKISADGHKGAFTLVVAGAE